MKHYIDDKNYKPGCEYDDGVARSRLCDEDKVILQQLIDKRKNDIENQLVHFFGVSDPLKYE